MSNKEMPTGIFCDSFTRHLRANNFEMIISANDTRQVSRNVDIYRLNPCARALKTMNKVKLGNVFFSVFTTAPLLHQQTYRHHHQIESRNHCLYSLRLMKMHFSILCCIKNWFHMSEILNKLLVMALIFPLEHSNGRGTHVRLGAMCLWILWRYSKLLATNSFVMNYEVNNDTFEKHSLHIFVVLIYLTLHSFDTE